MKAVLGNKITFIKKGQTVRGEVLQVDEKGFTIKLYTYYSEGRNEWFNGEPKYFLYNKNQDNDRKRPQRIT